MSQYKCTEDQLRKLRLFFKIDPLPTKAKREALAQELELTFKYVDRWFGRERAKQRWAIYFFSKFFMNVLGGRRLMSALRAFP